MCYEGDGVPKDEGKAFYLYQLALNLERACKAEKADREQQELDRIYQKGLGAYNAKDYQTALPLFMDAAGKGHAGARFYCAECFRGGLGTERDLLGAMHNYEAARKKGYKENGVLDRVVSLEADPAYQKAKRQREEQVETVLGQGPRMV